jgi:hypothetical protein
MEVIKIDDNNYAVYQNVDGVRKYCQFTIPRIRSPFGTEEFNKVTYLNLEIDINESYHSHLLGDVYKVERELAGYVGKEWVSSIRKKDKFKPLWKIRLNKRRGRYMFKSSKTFAEIDFKECLRVKVTLRSVWVRDGKCGAIYELDEVEQL